MIRLSACLTLFAVVIFLPATIFSQDDFLRVSAPGNRQLMMKIFAPTPAIGERSQKVENEIGEIFRQDLGITGIFTVTDQPEADLILKTIYTLAPKSVTFEYRLFEFPSGREILAKRYNASLPDIRKTAHTFSDDILYALTGERGPFTGKLAYVSTSTGNKEIYLMDWDGYNSRKLTANGSINLNPEFSPSGKEMVFTSYKNGNPDLYRRELFTGSEARISSAPGINITAAYAPEGNRIALAMSKDGNSEIYLITKEGKQVSRLTNNHAIDLSPTWSPDAKQIAFVSDRFGKPQLFTMSFDGSEVKRLTSNGGYNVAPRWSPKGDKIAYSRQYGSGFHIHLINPNGSDDRQITFEGNNEHPRWSPDGRFIVFSSKRGGTEAIYVMRADGSGQTKISRSVTKDSHPTWSPRW